MRAHAFFQSDTPERGGAWTGLDRRELELKRRGQGGRRNYSGTKWVAIASEIHPIIDEIPRKIELLSGISG